MASERGGKEGAHLLPPPEKLAVPVDTVKVTISLRRTSVDFFKRKALLGNTKYQKMIRELIDRYATYYAHW
jgi:hypothetical protein